MACAFGKDALATGLAVDHDDVPDCSDLVRRGVRSYRFPVRWYRAVASTTFYHDEPAVDQVDDHGDDGDGGGLVVSVLGPRSVSFECDALGAADVAFWRHDDPRWHRVDAAAWQGLPMTRVLVDAAGMRHYAELMTRLHAHGIEPMPVLDPSDMPEALDRVVDGWRSPLAVEAYAQFARAVFAHMGYLARTWVSLVPIADGGLDNESGQDWRRCARHVLLAQARAAAIYHRDLSGAGGSARGRFVVALSCHPEANIGAVAGYDPCAHFSRIAEAFAPFQPVAHDRDDGFAWGFTTAQRALLSRTADAIVLECTLQEPCPCGEYTADSGDAGSDTLASHGAHQSPTDQHTQALAFWIDQAAAILPGVPIIVCDGIAMEPKDDLCPTDMDVGSIDGGRAFDAVADGGLGMCATLPAAVCESGIGNDREAAVDVAAVVKNLAARFAAAHRASLAGRPVEMYLVRPA
nr:glycosyl hydrolase [Pandoravirus massiliensis]